jgi:hypothetical protein
VGDLIVLENEEGTNRHRNFLVFLDQVLSIFDFGANLSNTRKVKAQSLIHST